MDSDYFDDSDSSVEIGYTRRCIRYISSSDHSEVDQRGSFVNRDFVRKPQNHTLIVHNFSSGVTVNTQEVEVNENNKTADIRLRVIRVNCQLDDAV